MTPAEIAAILAKHRAWRRGEKNGQRADLSAADLSGASLYGADLSGASLSGASLSGADLSGANLSGANLSGASLYGANLSRANLSGADLSRADLSGANLYGANLYGASLYGASLSGASLYGANLSGANLSGANLSGANLPREMTLEAWCDAHDLATLPDGRRVAFKRLDTTMTTGGKYGHTTVWKRRGYVEAADWNDSQTCGGGLHLSPTPHGTRSYSSGEVCVPVAFALADAVHIGDKLKVRKCQVL